MRESWVSFSSKPWFLSTLAIFSLMSVSVSRRTREIGLRSALGANPRQVLAVVLSRAMVLMGSGVAGGSVLLLFLLALSGQDVAYYAYYAGWLAMTAVVMLAAGLLASFEPARRALRITPAVALRDA